MSASLSAQLDAAVAALRADNDAMTSALSAIKSEVAALVAAVPVGSTITQAQIDALNAAIGVTTSNVAELSSIETAASPPAPTEPAAEPAA